MTHPLDHQPCTAPSADRREFLRRAAIGASVAGAWVAPQVLFTGTAEAGCSPITKLLQINPCTCLQVTPSTFDGNLPSCAPSGWAAGITDTVVFTCTPAGGNPCHGGSITIGGGCGPGAGKAVKYCPLGSGPKYTCVDGVVTGGSIAFPYLSASERATGCVYVSYRITVTCCT